MFWGNDVGQGGGAAEVLFGNEVFTPKSQTIQSHITEGMKIGFDKTPAKP